MDTADHNDFIKRCYECDQDLLDNLNVVYNESNFMAVFWNKYQIFVYEKYEFQQAANIFIPDFQIKHLLVTDNYISCLDYSGTISVTSLKFKNATQKRHTSSFHPREHGVVACTLHDSHYSLSLKFEYNSYFLSIHKIDSEFPLITRVLLAISDVTLPEPGAAKYILRSEQLSKEEFESLKVVLNGNDYRMHNSLVIVSFNKLNVYGCLVGPKMAADDVKLFKLYTCPAEICSIEFTRHESLNLIIGLNIGTVIRLSLIEFTKEPKIVHLNTAISKFLVHKDSIIYTDGVSLWKSEKVFTEVGIKFHQYFVKHVKDMTKFGEKILCTTFSKMLYHFTIDDESCYLKPESTDEYCSAEKLFNNSEYLHRIIEEVDKNDDIIKQLAEEGNYITALSLSNRQDIMSDIIHCNVMVYDSFEDVINLSECILLEEMANYFEAETFLFLVTITTATIQHIFTQTLSNIFKNIKIHMTLSSERKQLKTSSTHIREEKKRIEILIPLKGGLLAESARVKLQLEIISNIPGSLDVKETIWSCLYRNTIVLGAEHFIRADLPLNRTNCLKNVSESPNNVILQISTNHYGDLFKISEDKDTSMSKGWSNYIKLPDNYKNILKTAICEQYLNTKKAKFIAKQYQSDEFLKSKSNISYAIGGEKVNLEIIDDSFSNPLLKVTGTNIKLVNSIRDFFSNIIYDWSDQNSPNQSKEFVNNIFYTTVENVQKSLKECITNSAPEEQLFNEFEQFERNVIGGLPL